MTRMHQYRNASYQGVISQHMREGWGILMDDNCNFMCSQWKEDRINGPSLLCLRGGLKLYGNWVDNQMEGINVLEKGDYKVVGRFNKGVLEGKIIASNSQTQCVYTISVQARDQLSVVNKYEGPKWSEQTAMKQAGVWFEGVQIGDFLETITHSSGIGCYKEEKDTYLGFSCSQTNLGLVFTKGFSNFDCGYYSAPFKKSESQRVNKLQSTSYINKTAYFPGLLCPKQHLGAVLNFLNTFQQRLFIIDNSEILVKYRSSKSPEDKFEDQELLKEFNSSYKPRGTPKKVVTYQKLNRSLEQLLQMQGQMMTRKSRTKDSVSFPADRDASRKRQRLKDEMFKYMQRGRTHLLPHSRCKSKTKSNTKSIPRSILKNKNKRPNN